MGNAFGIKRFVDPFGIFGGARNCLSGGRRGTALGMDGKDGMFTALTAWGRQTILAEHYSDSLGTVGTAKPSAPRREEDHENGVTVHGETSENTLGNVKKAEQRRD